ncbi:MAG: RNA-binding transcriptional accessory protein [Tannerellaceae bacterium]|nr:RNA-binding transcriptional accessory protein [Tannerellaceae bacterium]
MTSLLHYRISECLGINAGQVERTVELLNEGGTIPFISRYRKEATGGLDEVQIGAIKDNLDRLLAVCKRKETVIATIESQGKMTDRLRERIEATFDALELEDIYLPFKPKRTTKASVARSRGLEPLASFIMSQNGEDMIPHLDAALGDEVVSHKAALAGARDIIAEWINEDGKARSIVRKAFYRSAYIISKVIKGKEAEGGKFRDYFDYREPLYNCASHRLFAIRRGEDEGILSVAITPDMDLCLGQLRRHFIKGRGEQAAQVAEAIGDALKRLLKPSIETEYANSSKEKADNEAIKVFAGNLRHLLLSPPLGQKRVIGVDPGYRTGCKIVCLDEQGNLLCDDVIYPHPPRNETVKAADKLVKLVTKYEIEAISLGAGAGGRDTERFIRDIEFGRKVDLFVINEDGASVYSASQTARDEFPDHDVTVRGAVSIGRRLIDPLAELVKIEPRSIGVGQYQHDVDQGLLKKSLDQVVESCVNSVGVNVNTASKHLLMYVSGLGPVLAQNIVDFRTQNGPFGDRAALMSVPRMGARIFELSAGFLRIPGSDNPLDNSAVHPESYPVVQAMARDLNCSVAELIANRELRKAIRLEDYVDEKTGMPTLIDIMAELDKPGRDPRATITSFSFDPHVSSIEDLYDGMVLHGVVTNVTNFGCFVDIGIKEKGLVHISEMSDDFIPDPTMAVSVNQPVKVEVLEVDLERRRIKLSIKSV